MNSSLEDATHNQFLQSGVSFLTCATQKWWFQLMIQRVERTFDHGMIKWNKPSADRMPAIKILEQKKLAWWSQAKEASKHNDSFERVKFNVLAFSIKKQLDRNKKERMRYIWKKVCTKNFCKLMKAAKDAENVGSVYCRVSMQKALLSKRLNIHGSVDMKVDKT